MLKLFVVLVGVALVAMAAWATANYIKNRAKAATSNVALPGAPSQADAFEMEA